MKKFTAIMLLGGSLLSATAPAYAALTVEPQPSAGAGAATVHQPIETAGYWSYAQCVIENRVQSIYDGAYVFTFLTPVMIGMAYDCM